MTPGGSCRYGTLLSAVPPSVVLCLQGRKSPWNIFPCPESMAMGAPTHHHHFTQPTSASSSIISPDGPIIVFNALLAVVRVHPTDTRALITSAPTRLFIITSTKRFRPSIRIQIVLRRSASTQVAHAHPSLPYGSPQKKIKPMSLVDARAKRTTREEDRLVFSFYSFTSHYIKGGIRNTSPLPTRGGQ